MPFQRGGNFESPCQILRCITDVWSPSLSEKHSKWGNMSWSHECGRRIIFENLLGTNAVSFKGVDTFQQLHTSSVPWGERQHRGEIDRHCLAPFCWRKAHCCFEIRMIGHFFRNYIWLFGFILCTLLVAQCMYHMRMDWLMTKKMLSKRIMPYICNWWQGRKKSFTLGGNYECLAIRQTLTLTSQDHVTWKWLTVT